MIFDAQHTSSGLTAWAEPHGLHGTADVVNQHSKVYKKDRDLPAHQHRACHRRYRRVRARGRRNQPQTSRPSVVHVGLVLVDILDHIFGMQFAA